MLQTLKPTKRRKVAAPSETQQPWIEKYRPRTLNDVAAQTHTVTILKRTLKSANLPHMLFYGPPGTGKTSTILALTAQLFGPDLLKSRVLELNASDERGISIVREKIKDFARLTVSKPSKEDLEKYPCPPYKIIILDEADSMTTDAQSALRRTMETYSKVTRFCLICNYVTRIIDPLISRCSKFRFKSLDSANALSRLQYITTTENLKCDTPVLERILEISAGDLRRAITLLQSASTLVNYLDSPEVTQLQVQELAGVIPDSTLNEMVQTVKDGDIDAITEYVNTFVKNGWSTGSVLTQLHQHYITNDYYDTQFKNEVSWLLFQTDAKLSNGTNERLQLLNLLVKVSRVQ